MSAIISEKEVGQFKKDGYIYVKNFFNEQEVNTFLKGIEKKSLYIKNENIDNTVDIEELWEFICHKKMLELIKLLIGNKIHYLHTSNILSDSINLERQSSTWHRDNPCRRTGYGPDWNNKEKYNVVSSIVYLTETDSTLNVIKKSHLKNYKYTISNILRTIDMRLRKFRSLNFLKKIIKEMIGKDLKYKSGDLIVFYTTLYHTRSIAKNGKNGSRNAFISRYGADNIHSKTYLNYEMNYRMGTEKYKISEKKDTFFQKLKDNDIYISPQTDKEEIDGIFLHSNKNVDNIHSDDYFSYKK